MKKYRVETTTRILATVTDKDLAIKLFEQRKELYRYIELNEVTKINGNTYVESLKIKW